MRSRTRLEQRHMSTATVRIAAVTIAFCLLFAAATQARETDQIRFSPTGDLSPEGWAGVTVFYSCAARPGTTTYLDMAAVQDFAGAASFDELSEPLTCNGKTNKIVHDNGSDFDPYVPGPARVEASFWNDVLGGWNSGGFGTRVVDTVVLR